eukprot:Amastigsp_a339960_35.p3 type:complete len:149 gc:universal Amastigsp_a339960_35:1499-1053(-)
MRVVSMSESTCARYCEANSTMPCASKRVSTESTAVARRSRAFHAMCASSSDEKSSCANSPAGPAAPHGFWTRRVLSWIWSTAVRSSFSASFASRGMSPDVSSERQRLNSAVLISSEGCASPSSIILCRNDWRYGCRTDSSGVSESARW